MTDLDLSSCLKVLAFFICPFYFSRCLITFQSNALWTLSYVWEEMNTFLSAPITVSGAVTRGLVALVANSNRNNPVDTRCGRPEGKTIPGKLLENILETLRERPFGNQLPYL